METAVQGVTPVPVETVALVVMEETAVQMVTPVQVETEVQGDNDEVMWLLSKDWIK